MTTDTAVRPGSAPEPAAAEPLPLQAAGRDLQARLAARAAREGAPAPRVAVIGAGDVLRREDPHVAEQRAAATVHLTADAVLIGPWGGTPDTAACGCCLAVRWQRLRTRTERDALETGLSHSAAGSWPVLPDYTADAVWALYRLTATGSASPAPDPASAGGGVAPAGGHVPGAGPAPARTGGGSPPAGRPLPVAASVGDDSVPVRVGGLAPTGRPPRAAGKPAPVGNGSGTGRGSGLAPADDALPRVTRLDLETGLVSKVPLHAEPLCPHAPHGRAAAEREAFPVSREKPAADRYRLRAPGGYDLPAAALANPVCGVLGAGTWSDVTSPTTAPVAGSVFMRGYAGLTDVTWSGQSHSFAASRDLAFLEGLERYAGTHRRERGGIVTDSYDNLGDAALDPRDCGMYAPQTYRDDPMIAPFDPARPIPWVRGWSLRDDRPVLVPARLVYYSAGTAADHFVFECSNGCATGSCLEEAVLFGLLELIERDAFLLAWYGSARLTEIDLGACSSPVLRAMTDRAALCGYDVHAFDNRIDLSVPVVTGLAVRRDGGPGTLAFAAGAAFDPETAVEAAVSEILTYLPHLPRQVTERPAELDAMADDFGLVRRLPDHAALFGLPRMARYVDSYLEPKDVGSPAQVYAEWEDRRPRGLDLREDILWCTRELARAGCDVIVVDQTAPEQRAMGLRTVCTIAPGLLPIDFGWARQRALTMPRLRTAQRRAGMRPDDLRESEVRRVPHPFP
ncbi:TOMM precursor leader peptide-binding protein [Actinacidiphila bryophytorum]|uniref:TOMM precursor leader peptide-binding protein n=1 Tax=Actinacidiphila bryophytorum TaxID=1436133 RepID=UPI001980AB9A|nr:TOMM precursor leader peptide-binding protein [Actinacidiphila bryophytorum]MBN6544103.1 TOMM precursor leader peptide-binding protein [Actinacidiphila bryophytorum]